ncbi:SMODS domain-containing nucleotidyltransferase [Herbiconiux sp. YIM B11900]|uniref:SMODS domain-containing nucleotidyltransferase n=1 Tax=Herbiconiux sp. YIM B11900 TaxID=3404131 RepID=UPI003F861B97
MKLIKHFDAFLVNKVNLSDSRITSLDKRVEAVSNFLQAGDDDFATNFIDLLPQGSYAHRTIINPVGSNDEFDADVLLYIDEVDEWEAEDYVEELYKVFRANPTYRNMVSRHDRCVKVDYANEFHIDVVPYLLRHGQNYITNRVTDEFELTNPEGYNAWLDEKNRLASGRLIKVVRLIKYLRDHKNTFSVKSVILSILLGGQVKDSAVWGDNSDYPDVPTALRSIAADLDDYLQANPTMPSIDDPSEPSENFNHRWDQDQYANFRDKLHMYRGWIDDAYEEENLETSKTKWRKLFGDKFGTYDLTVKKATEAHRGVAGVQDTEETIESKWGIPVRLNPAYKVKLGARTTRKNGFRHYELSSQGNVVAPNRTINFRLARHNVQGPFDLYWKVRNTGKEAIDNDCIRGQVEKDSGSQSRQEPTKYKGRHYVECYVVVNGICVAIDRHYVNIK